MQGLSGPAGGEAPSSLPLRDNLELVPRPVRGYLTVSRHKTRLHHHNRQAAQS